MKICSPLKNTFFLVGLISILASTSLSSIIIQKNDHLIGAGINRLIIFLLINLHILIIIGLLFAIIQKSVILLSSRHKEEAGTVFKKNIFFALVFLSIIPALIITVVTGKIITTSINAWFENRIATNFNAYTQIHAAHTQKLRQTVHEIGLNLLENKATPLTKPEIQAFYKVSNRNLDTKIIKQEQQAWRTFRLNNNRSTHDLWALFVKKINYYAHNPGCFDFYGSLYWVGAHHDTILILVHRYPKNIRDALIQADSSYWDYETIKQTKNPIFNLLILIYGIISLIIILLALWCAIYLAKGISTPIVTLIEAINTINEGNLHTRLNENPSNDLYVLFKNFNVMTQSLDQAYASLKNKNNELALIMQHIHAGAIIINNMGRILIQNDYSQQLCPFIHEGKRFNKQSQFFNPLRSMIKKLLIANNTLIQEELITQNNNNENYCYLLSIHNLTHNQQLSASSPCLLIIINDLTQPIKINTMKTWQNAAKQIAHEIKNPLTPIQLATQRLQKRFGSSVNNPSIFNDCIKTILEQVDCIKQLITHFCQFATLPTIELKNENIGTLINEVIQRYTVSYPSINIINHLQIPHPTLLTDAQAFKRVLTNLFDNSIQALKKQQNTAKQPMITISAEYNTNTYCILFKDNGPGVDTMIKKTLFLPYVSTQKKNMGLGLAIVHDTLKELGGSIALDSSAKETTFIIQLPMPKSC